MRKERELNLARPAPFPRNFRVRYIHTRVKVLLLPALPNRPLHFRSSAFYLVLSRSAL